MIKKQGSEKGNTLVYWFEQMMELGDASDEEAPPPCPRKREMSKYSWLQMISMLQSMQCYDGLWRGSITIITKRVDVACSTVYQLWEQVAHTHATGDNISLEINSWKKLREACYISDRGHPGGCQECPTAEEAYPKKTHNIDGGIKDNRALLDCWFNHSCSFYRRE